MKHQLVSVGLLLFLQGGCVSAVPAAPVAEERIIPVHSRIEAPTLSTAGRCETAGHSFVDMEALVRLPDTEISVADPNKSVSMRIEGEGVLIEWQSRDDGSFERIRIDRLVAADENDDPDLQLSFAQTTGGVALYWRETYQHRIYRQGLFRIVGARLEQWCQGRGGVYIDGVDF